MKVIVIGCGIVGASAAYSLAKKNVDVVMIDKEHEGNATAAGAGIVCPWISRVDNDAWYTIARGGAKYYPDLIADLIEDGEEDVGYKKVGALSVSEDPDVLDSIEEKVRKKQKNSPELGDVVRLSPEKSQELFPPLNKHFESVYVSGAARVDGKLLREAMKRAAQKNGATLISGEASLMIENEKVVGVTVNEETVYADAVLITAGAWAPSLLNTLGLDLGIEPQRGQIAHIELPGSTTTDWPVVLPQRGHYMLAFDDSRVVAGATRETGSGFDYRTTVNGINEVLSEAMDVAPGLADGKLKEVRIGFRPMGPDILPLLGTVHDIPNVVLATGLGASGLTMGPYVGALAASIVQDEKLDIDLTPYSPNRALTMIHS